MARYREPVCRLCRREGMKLFLKGDRCFKPSCAIEKRNFPPGQHGQSRKSKIVGYGLQLAGKAEGEANLRRSRRPVPHYFEKAARQKGVTGENLLHMLERRLDNVVYRLGFASSRSQARQLVRHGHVLVNSKKVNIPSFQVKPGDEICNQGQDPENSTIINSLEMVGGRGVPHWLELDGRNSRAKC